MLDNFKWVVMILFAIFIPHWVFSNVGLDLTASKLAYVYENRHALDWYGLLFEKYFFPIICTISLWLNLFIVKYAVPIMSFVKNTR